MARGRILLAHANTDCQTIYGSVLKAEGYEVAVADSVEGALQQLAATHHDAVVADLYLTPGELRDNCLLRQIRDSRTTAHLPTVIITAWTTEGHRDMARELGADRFLGLPTTPRELAAVLAELLEQPPSTSEISLLPPSDPGSRPATDGF